MARDPTSNGAGSGRDGDDAASAAARAIGGGRGSGDETTFALNGAEASARPASLPADFFPGYEILAEISRGGQGVVYKALQLGTRRRVAIKVMREGPLASPTDRARFEREIHVLGALRHRNIVTIHASGEAAGCSYYVMDYIAGESLPEWLARGGRSVREIVTLFAKLCDAIGAAHARGIVHRDLKPSNIRIDTDGEPAILDFGLAKAGAAAGPGTAADAMTGTGQFVGSPAYASPEQMEGSSDRIDARSDVYSLGVLVHYMLCGTFPYPMPESFDAVRSHVLATPPTPLRRTRHDVDIDLETIVLRCLAKERERRYPDARALHRDVQRFLAGEPIEARRDSLAYLVRMRVRKESQRRPASMRVACGLLGVIAGLGVHAIPDRWTWPDRPLEQALLRERLHSRVGWADELSVVGLSDSTVARLDELARQAGAADVRADVVPSWRALHGALMTRLAVAAPRVVAWDLTFRSPAGAADDAFVAGVAALHRAGTRVVIGVRDVAVDGSPRISPAIADAIDDWGWLYLNEHEGVVRSVWLAVSEPRATVRPSLALAAVSAYRAGRELAFVPFYDFSEHADHVRVEYWRTEAGRRLPAARLPRVDLAPFTLRLPRLAYGLPPDVDASGRVVAAEWIVVPDREALARKTIAYEAVLAMNEAELKERFGDRIVMIGDIRDATTTTPDRYGLAESRDGSYVRSEYGVYFHGAGVSTILQGVGFVRRSFGDALISIAMAAGVGLAIGGFAARSSRVPLQWAICIGGVALIAGLAIGSSHVVGRFVRPSEAMIAGATAAALSILLRPGVAAR